MRKEEYSFSAKYQNVDFARILNENSEADFIRVDWKDEDDEKDARYLVTKKGYKRIKAVDMAYSNIYSLAALHLDAKGSLHHTTSYPDSSYNIGYMLVIFKKGSSMTKTFEEFYGKLREREERKHPIKITVID